MLSLSCWLATSHGAESQFSPHNEIAEWEALNYDIIEEALDNYYKCFDDFPTGNNREVIRQLSGLNPKGKRFFYLGNRWIFDRNGFLLDEWGQPYQFTFSGSKRRVVSTNYEIGLAARKDGQNLQFPKTPDGSREAVRRIESIGYCYQLALGVKILVQLKGKALPLDQIKKLLFATHAGDPIIFTFDHKTELIDPWGTPYVIELSDQRVFVHSKHTSYVAVESLPRP
jgi:hypothetical protein